MEIKWVKCTKHETHTEWANKSDLKMINWQYKECLLLRNHFDQ